MKTYVGLSEATSHAWTIGSPSDGRLPMSNLETATNKATRSALAAIMVLLRSDENSKCSMDATATLQPYRGRVRTGCLECRAKKVKCDEQHPVCRRCTRQQKTCTYSKKKRNSLTTSSILASKDERNIPSTPLLYIQSGSGSVSQEILVPRRTVQEPLGRSSPQDGEIPLRQQHGENPLAGITCQCG